jgi:hypothetical protein
VRFILVVLALAACSRDEPRASVATATSVTSAASVTPVVVVVDASAAKRCLPVVAADCGCTYSCGSGTETSPGKWTVVHPFWAPHALDAKIAPWCVGSDCTDAFHAQIVCSAICSPKPADHTCHFEGDRCVSGQKP